MGEERCTPGYWKAQQDGVGYSVVDVATRNPVLQAGIFCGQPFIDCYDCDARLAAAAPQLLEALKAVEWSRNLPEPAVCPCCNRSPNFGHDGDCQLAAAIKAATEGE